MAPTPEQTRQALTTAFEKKISAGLALLTKSGPITAADLDTLSSTLADNLAADAEKIVTAVSASAAAGVITRAAARLTPGASVQPIASAPASQMQHLCQLPPRAHLSGDAAYDDFAAKTFGTEREYDPNTGQHIPSIPLVRIAK